MHSPPWPEPLRTHARSLKLRQPQPGLPNATPDPTTASVSRTMVAARSRLGVSHSPPRALSQARIPEALPTATAAVAAHCMHMERGYPADQPRTRIGKDRFFGARSESTRTWTRYAPGFAERDPMLASQRIGTLAGPRQPRLRVATLRLPRTGFGSSGFSASEPRAHELWFSASEAELAAVEVASEPSSPAGQQNKIPATTRATKATTTFPRFPSRASYEPPSKSQLSWVGKDHA